MRVIDIVHQAEFAAKTNWLMAVDILQRGIEKYPEEPALYQALGDILTQRERYKEAIDFFQRSLAFSPSDNNLIFRIANCYLTIGEPKLALEYYDMIATPFPESWYNKAIALLHLDRYEECVDALEYVIASKPINELPYYFIAEEYIVLHRYDKALQHLLSCERQFGEKAELLALKGLCYSNTKQWMAAYLAFKKAERLQYSPHNFHHAMAICCENVGLLDEALTHYDEAIEENPYFQPAYNDFVRLLYRRNLTTRALRLIQKAKRNIGYLSPSLSIIQQKILQENRNQREDKE